MRTVIFDFERESWHRGALTLKPADDNRMRAFSHLKLFPNWHQLWHDCGHIVELSDIIGKKTPESSNRAE